MKKRKTFLKAGVMSVLVLGLSVACIPAVVAHSTEQAAGAAQEQAAAPAVFDKTEIVYATLTPEGAAKGVYVVNQFEVEQAGEVVDYGPYSTVANLTDQSGLDFADGEAVFNVGEGAFYYQGNVAVDGAKLPWDVRFEYELDGEAVSPEELAGKSGALSIHVTTSPAAGVDRSFADSYMLQITFTLNGDTTSDIVAEGATLASAGRNRTVAFTVLPGRNADCVLSAQVVDFEMSGVQIAALPYSMAMEMPDAGDLTGQMEELTAAISEMDVGIAELAVGSSAFGEGLNAVAAGAPLIAQYSSVINVNLSKISAGLSVENMMQVADSLNDLADYIEFYAGELDKYQGAVNGVVLAYTNNQLSPDELAALEAAGGAGSGGVAADPAASGVSKLLAVYKAAGKMSGILNSSADGKPALAQTMYLICGSVEDEGSLRYMAAQLRGVANGIYSDGPNAQTMAVAAAGLAELSSQYSLMNDNIALFASGVTELNANYVLINEGTQQLAGGVSQLNQATINIPSTMRAEIEAMMADYEFPEFDPISFVDSRNNANMAAVQFVLTTEAIEVAEPEKAEEPEEEEETVVDRFFALFE